MELRNFTGQLLTVHWHGKFIAMPPDGCPTELPPEEEGVGLVVSNEVAGAHPDRRDLYRAGRPMYVVDMGFDIEILQELGIEGAEAVHYPIASTMLRRVVCSEGKG